MDDEHRKYQCWALTENNKLIHVDEARKNNVTVFCPYCHCELMPKCGNVRMHHFAHNYHYSNERNCSYESYLHAYAKLRLKEWFDESEKIIIHLPYKNVCPKREECLWNKDKSACAYNCVEFSQLDIKKVLDECTAEERITIGNNIYRCDLIWKKRDNPKNRILVEIKVTHECTEKKKNSLERIIEFEIHSEEDVEKIVSNDIIESKTTHFYGFKQRTNYGRPVLSKFELEIFTLDHNSRFNYSTRYCNSSLAHNPDYKFELTFEATKPKNKTAKEKNIENNHFRLWGLIIANYIDRNVKDCYLCKNLINNGYKTCTENKSICFSTDTASKCQAFEIDIEKRNKYLNELKDYCSTNPVGLWRPDKPSVSATELIHEILESQILLKRQVYLDEETAYIIKTEPVIRDCINYYIGDFDINRVEIKNQRIDFWLNEKNGWQQEDSYRSDTKLSNYKEFKIKRYQTSSNKEIYIHLCRNMSTGEKLGQ